MGTAESAITAMIGGRTHARADVLNWESRRIDAAAKKLGVAVPTSGDLNTRREAWLHAKRSLGDDEILRRLHRDTAVADALARSQARVSRRRRLCLTELVVPGAASTAFTEWFTAITVESNRDEMERACPDHFVLRTADGIQEVVETNGGSPLAARFTIDYDDVSSLVTPIDPLFAHRLDGVARASDGTPIGGVRHQFRDTPAGVHARLVIEFPLLMLPSVVHGHRWHLACEFSNWFEACAAASR
ncbi:hypothetical protein [Gordonia phthalatica]|uniref:Uncharacterized protein n=1 Tax=Gordonia phthalatica TaxID=1136941 RepID=A0A0N9N3I3_9ACTN|nr:hypothetical protein [Gordonia phthalatica]ALG84897.1 hypothetical protein ACH46_10810 [Gordonia phthalatica]